MTTRFANSRAFTLVETLVAIAILMISISGPLAIANKALVASLYAKDQSTASFLAQEEMEIIKNLKDNSAPGSNWLNGYLNSCIGSVKCDLSVANNSNTILAPNHNYSCSSIGCRLNTTNNGYDSYLSGSPTIFYRYFNLTGSGCVANSSGSECQATVVVNWNEGTVPNAVTMSSELLNVAP